MFRWRMIAALLNLAVFAALVLCIIGFGVYGDTKRKAWPIAKPKGAVATPAAPLEFSIYFDAGATVTPRSCLLSQEGAARKSEAQLQDVFG